MADTACEKQSNKALTEALAPERVVRVPFANPESGTTLVLREGKLRDTESGESLGEMRDGIARFVEVEDDYAEAFGWQWHHWTDSLSESRNPGVGKRSLIFERSGLDRYELEGQSLLECGMGGGDDTEVLLELPFAQVHAFDLSNSVDRAARFLDDPRLTISQASITSIPYADESFDVVFCHRVLQHTPDPEASLRAVCRKVKPGGLLFAHCYKKGVFALMQYKYKYRWLTKRLPHAWIHRFVEAWGPRLHAVNERLRHGNLFARAFAYNFIPFQYLRGHDLERSRLIELEKLCTFDALTPLYDNPMTTRRFTRVLREEGFEIVKLLDPDTSPVCATARKAGSSAASSEAATLRSAS